MIGILSGMGAAAGVHVLDLLIAECQRRGARADKDFPEILLYNLPASGMNEKGVTDENAIRVELLGGVKLLNEAGCRFIIIACNTVHVYREMLQRKSDALILDMPTAAIRTCAGLMKIGVLSSRTTRETGLYEKAIKKMLGAECLQVSECEQGAVDMMIGHIIAGTVEGRHEIALQSIISDLVAAGAEKVILACTELPLMPLEFKPGLLVDPAQEVVEEVLSL
jgi:aspartate racemase